MRNEKEMLDMIINVANEDENIEHSCTRYAK